MQIEKKMVSQNEMRELGNERAELVESWEMRELGNERAGR